MKQESNKKENATGKMKSPVDAIPLEIRKPKPQEMFYRTGNAEYRQCICVREMVGSTEILQRRYLQLNEPALSEVICWATPVLFHEVVSGTGECFAYPQVLGDDPSVPATWRATEDALLREPLCLWACFTYGDEPGEYDYGLSYEWADSPSITPCFSLRLDEALGPDIIESVDHPVVRRLQAIFGDLEDNTSEEWANIG